MIIVLELYLLNFLSAEDCLKSNSVHVVNFFVTYLNTFSMSVNKMNLNVDPFPYSDVISIDPVGPSRPMSYLQIFNPSPIPYLLTLSSLSKVRKSIDINF